MLKTPVNLTYLITICFFLFALFTVSKELTTHIKINEIK